jgi:undecaprenyl diphosphate synthase
MNPGKKLHIAIIPDGNRRWAKQHGKPSWYGHRAGAKKFEDLAKWCAERDDIGMVTLYALSTENLKRSEEELSHLWSIYREEINKFAKNNGSNGHKFKIVITGDAGAWRKDFKDAALDVMKATKNYTGGVLNILLAYGSQFEILNSVKKIAAKGIHSTPIIEKMFNKCLMVSDPVDLVIRTGDEHRLSNFLLYQAAYAEIHFSKSMWPDFSKKEFEDVLDWYHSRERRLGK